MEDEKAAANLSADFETVQKDEDNESDQSDTSISCGKWFLFALFRILIVFTIAGLSFLIPNIHILLTLAGSVLGTVVNIVLPVLFYNRAYNWTDKNKKQQKLKGGDNGDDESEKLMENEGMDGEGKADKSESPATGDPRLGVKIGNWIVLILGVAIGIVGLTYCIIEIKDGEAKADEA